MDEDTIKKWSDEDKKLVMTTILNEYNEKRKAKEGSIMLSEIFCDVKELTQSNDKLTRSFKDYQFLVLTCLFLIIYMMFKSKVVLTH